jgi:single-stranded-DNA-specific exonuclease
MLPDMEKAVERIKQAVGRREKILLVGDYDVDGVISLAIFYEFIKEFNELFSFYIPNRIKEGYGLNCQLVKEARDKGIDLIICFDCGTNSLKEIELARRYGIDTIVVDHHEVKDNLNNSFAFINPKRKDSRYPFSDLSGAVISFKLLQALKGTACFEVLDLLALSLVCDVVPLKGENRIFLYEGIKHLRKSNRPSIRALCEVAGIKQDSIDTFHIGYIIGPRINASGRVAEGKDSLEIFLTEDEKKTFDLASKLGGYNQLRRDIEAEVLKETEELLNRELLDTHAIVVTNEGWHRGVLGIVASRLVDRYYRPSFVISLDGDLGIGSGRSIPSVPLIDILHRCADSLLVYGGHKKAVGFKLLKHNLEGFKKKINKIIEESTDAKELIPSLDIDLILNFDDISMSLVEELEILPPFGEENPPPLFVSYNIFKKTAPKKVNNGYSLWLSDGLRTFEGIVYDKDVLTIVNYADKMDIVYSLGKNNYHNTAKLIIRDCRLSGNEPSSHRETVNPLM